MKKLILFGALIIGSNLSAQTPGGGVTDVDGNNYNTVIIGNQEWMAENLRVGSYNNGDYINVVEDGSIWYQLNIPSACWYNNDSLSNVSTYGKLYNWYVVNDSRNVCPSDWRVPSDDDWDTLELFIVNSGFSGQDGKALKSTSGWNSNGNGTDNFGFNALPSGYRYDDNNSTYYSLGSMAYFWSSSNGINFDAMYRKLEDVADTIRTNEGTAKYGFSIRCMKDYTGSGVGLIELYDEPKNLVKIVDLMGRETEFKPNIPLIFIYSDGTRERVMKLEE